MKNQNLLIEEMLKFRVERTQNQFYNSKAIALVLYIESSKLTDLFLENI